MAMPSGRFVAVASGIASVCAILLLCLAGSQYSNSVFNGQSDRSVLEQTPTLKANEVKQLEAIMLKQQQMEGKEQKLLASIEKGEAHAAKMLETEKKQAVHAAAARKAQAKTAPHPSKVVAVHKAVAAPKAQVKTVAPKAAATKAKMQAIQSVSLSESGSADLGGSPKASDAADDKVAKLKAELAKAEAEEKKQKEQKAAKKETATDSKAADSKKSATAAKADSVHPITGKDFIKLPDNIATAKDKKIAKEAGLHPMGWMGSAKSIDNMLRKLNCDPASFVCSGTPAQKKQALAIIKKIQESIMSDSTQVKAYGWKEEHALPPAPHM